MRPSFHPFQFFTKRGFSRNSGGFYRRKLLTNEKRSLLAVAFSGKSSPHQSSEQQQVRVVAGERPSWHLLDAFEPPLDPMLLLLSSAGRWGVAFPVSRRAFCARDFHRLGIYLCPSPALLACLRQPVSQEGNGRRLAR